MRATTPLLFGLGALALLGCSGEPVNEAAAAACPGGTSHAAVITSLSFTRENPPGVAPGFNLDGIVSTGHDYQSCLKKDYVDPQGRDGIDNLLADLVPEVEHVYGGAVDGLVQGAINNGELIILLDVEGTTGTENDACVNLAVETGKGAVALGTDGVVEGYQTFDIDTKNPRSVGTKGRIRNGELTVGPFDMAVPIAIFDVKFTLHFYGSMFRFTIDADGNIDGLFGGGIDVQELLAGVKQGAGVANSIGLIEVALNASTDLAEDKDGICRQLSSALAFKAVPAFVRK